MYRLYGRDYLIIAVAAGMIVRPRDGSRVGIVNCAPCFIRVEISRVKKMRAPDAAQRAERGAQILMVPCGEDASPALTKARDALTVRSRQTVANVNGKQPELIKV
jgi:hypothetical protein